MLMLYSFALEVLDPGLDYSFSTEWTFISETHHDRTRLIRAQFAALFGAEVKRSVLVGARALTYAETSLLDVAGTANAHVWLVTRVRPSTRGHAVRHLPRLQSETKMYELMERMPRSYDRALLLKEQYAHNERFAEPGSFAAKLLAAA